jgi:hypothetical protein
MIARGRGVKHAIEVLPRGKTFGDTYSHLSKAQVKMYYICTYLKWEEKER